MPSQSCPNCQKVHETGVYVTGQRVLCRCGIRFEVRRDDVSTLRGAEREAPPEPSIAPTLVRGSSSGGAGPVPAGVPSTFVTSRVALPGYELLEILGRGGMGEVWRARQLSLQRVVAVKLLPPQLAKDPEFVSRFDTEATALASLSHPHIVQIIDRGSEGEHYYFVMEYVEGRSLREFIGKGLLTAQEALRIVLQVCRAMEAAHEKGIIHRDLKPENILIDERGHVKVADFGLAGIRRPDSRHQLTATAVAMGTVNYMAPEQRRDAKNVDGRADLFSLGVLFYELLTGELPVGRFKLPSEKIPSLDARTDRILERLLESDPEARYPSAREVSAALEPLITSSSSGVTLPEARPERTAPPPARASLVRSLESGWKGLRLGLAVVGGLALLGFLVRSLVGPVSVHVDGGGGNKVVIGTQGVDIRSAQKGSAGWPPNTHDEIFVGSKLEEAPGAPARLEVSFDPGDEELNAWAGSWRLAGGQLHVVQAGSDSGGGRLVPRAYVAHRYFSSDDFTAEVRVDVKPVPPRFLVEEDAQHFAELAFRIKDLQVSAFAIPDVGMRLSWRYVTPDGVEVVGNSAQDLENMVEDEMPLPAQGPFLVRLQLRKRKGGVELQGFLNHQRFARKVLPGFEGRVAKVALGCRNLSCTFDDLKIRGVPMPRPRPNRIAGARE